MKLGLLLSLLLTFSGIGFCSPTLTFPSQTVSSSGDTEIDMITPFNLDTQNLPPDQQSGLWETLKITCQVDTRYIDMRFKHKTTGQTLLLSSLSSQTGLSSYLVTDQSAGVLGLVGATATPQNSNLYQITFIISGVDNDEVVSNLLKTGSPAIPITLIAHGSAIANAGGSYQIQFSTMPNDTFVIPVSRNVAQPFRVTVQGGQFTVSEPGTFFAFGSGLFGLLTFLKHQKG